MVQGTVSPRFNAASTYTDDYGVYNSDPLDHEAARAVDLTPCSTTYGMNAGTVRATRQLPGQRHMLTALRAVQPHSQQQLFCTTAQRSAPHLPAASSALLTNPLSAETGGPTCLAVLR